MKNLQAPFRRDCPKQVEVNREFLAAAVEPSDLFRQFSVYLSELLIVQDPLYCERICTTISTTTTTDLSCYRAVNI